jgi:hypothetical protein
MFIAYPSLDSQLTPNRFGRSLAIDASVERVRSTAGCRVEHLEGSERLQPRPSWISVMDMKVLQQLLSTSDLCWSNPSSGGAQTP